MNWNQIENNWKELKNNIQQQWAELTEDDLNNMSGNRDELTGKIQQTYGMDRQNAEKEVDAWQTSQDDVDTENNKYNTSNTMFNNKFGYDETSSNQIQSGHDNTNMRGTNSLSTDASLPMSNDNLINESHSPEALSVNDDNADYSKNDQLTLNNIITNNFGMNDSATGFGQTPIENNASNNNSPDPDDVGGPGESEDDENGDDFDKFDTPIPNPMPDGLERPPQSNSETPHQKKSLDQT